VSVLYGSHVWSQLPIPLNEGIHHGGAGGNYRGFGTDTSTNNLWVAEKGVSRGHIVTAEFGNC